MPTPRDVTFFDSAADFRAWLEANHDTASELWMGLRSKDVTPRGLTWADAVPEALCFGWIDSVSHRYDDTARAQRWTPRRPGSNWSKVNVAHVERLIAEGRMRPAGLAAYEARSAERTGVYSYELDTGELPEEYAAPLAADPRAQAFWDVATAGYRKICVRWVLGAKQAATRERRAAQLAECCAAGELIASQRYGDPPGWLARARAAADAAAQHR